ncbi:hypothetical protein, partial [Mycobacterium sp.]|uniref:hypothetical protein n=1 Tax=Mycobacterium sp. TaxID=1785 RepID=UPI003F9CFDF7
EDMRVLTSSKKTLIVFRRSGTPHFDKAMGRAHTCGMELCDLTAVALTAAPLPVPRSLRRIQASTSPRPA